MQIPFSCIPQRYSLSFYTQYNRHLTTTFVQLAVERPSLWKELDWEGKNTRIWNMIKAPQRVRKEMIFFPSAEPPSWILEGIMMISDSYSLISSRYLRTEWLDESKEREFFPETQKVLKILTYHELLKYIDVIPLPSFGTDNIKVINHELIHRMYTYPIHL